ncbi:unnamed protein product [Diamesa serratosioi]
MQNLWIFGVILLSSSWNLVQSQDCQGLPDDTIVAEPSNCYGYWYCTNGEPEDYTECPDGEEWDEAGGYCDDENVVGCANGLLPVDPEPITTQAPVITTQSPVITTQSPVITTQAPTTLAPGQEISCPTDRNGDIVFFPSSNCTNYYICANGVQLNMRCLDGFAWNQQDKQCDFPIFTTCGKNIEIVQNQVRCMRFGFYVTAHPEDCAKFVFCSEGIPLIQNCPVGYLWDISEKCVERMYAKCPIKRSI